MVTKDQLELFAELEYKADNITREVHELGTQCQTLNLDNPVDYARLMKNQRRFDQLESEILKLSSQMKILELEIRRSRLRVIK